MLDESALAQAHAKLGPYASPVYGDFEVTGLRVARCRGCDSAIRGGTCALKAHKSACHRRSTRIQPRLHPADHFVSVDEARQREKCWHCDQVVCTGGSRSKALSHLATCANVSYGVRSALNEWAVACAHAEDGPFADPVYRGFDVTGLHVAQCHDCKAIVRGGTSALKRHKEHSCARRAPNAPINIAEHFHAAYADGRQRCRYCSRVVTTSGSRAVLHLDKCTAASPALRPLLDEWAVLQARAKLGPYANPVFLGFKVTGLHVARCLTCIATVRGETIALIQHTRRFCQRAAHDVAPINPADHFEGIDGDDRRQRCRHCSRLDRVITRRAICVKPSAVDHQ